MLPEPFDLALLTLVVGLVAGGLPIVSGLAEKQSLLTRLTGVAAGVLIASAMLVVIPEGFHIAEGGVEGLALGGAILAGFLFMLVLECSGIGHSVHEEHHDHSHSHGHDHVHHPENALMVVIGLTIHAATDGLAIGAAAATEHAEVGLLILLAVLAHKVPAAFSVGVFSLHERGVSGAAWRDVIIFAIATPLMIVLAFALLQDIEEHMLGLAMLFSGGTFLYVATVDVLPDVHNSETGKAALLNVLMGAALMLIVLLLVGDLHAH